MPNLSQLLTSYSSLESQRVFEACRDLAVENDGVNGVYVVGGVVRDLVIGREPGDIDISVEGDAAGFATMLASRIGATAPVESQFLTFKIDTSDVFETFATIDIVTARSETYSESASLPDVETSSIEADLLRRDFTVNSMGISLSVETWGALFDPSNGFADILRKRIKVHHDGSFLDDPTRIFRAIRYASRLGFSFDARTEQLIENSIEVIDNLSGDRVRREFELILNELGFVEMLKSAEELDILAAISPGFRIGAKNFQILESLTENHQIPNDNQDLLALITFGLSDDEAAQVVARFNGPLDWGESIIGNAELAKRVTVLDRDDLQPSEVEELLHDVPEASIRAYQQIGPPLPRQKRLKDYLETIRFVTPEINGDDLLEIGIPPGPIIGEIMDIVRRARLDSKVVSKQEELELARSRFPGFLTS